MTAEIFAEPFQRFPSAVGNVGVVGVGQIVEIRPEERDPLVGYDLNRLEGPLRLLAGEELPEPLQRLAFTEPGKRAPRGLAHLWMR